MSQNIIEVQNLTKAYGATTILQGVNMNIPKGSVYGFLGANGAGKTTTLKILTGIIQKTDGSVKIFGENWKIDHLSRVGALVERPMLYENNTGYENLKIHSLISGVDDKNRINEVLEIVGLDSKASKKFVKQYSLGMKQRLAIGVSLLHKPELLVLDEVTNGIDIEGVCQMRNLVASLSESGITIIISSHALAEIEKICSHIGVISKGKMKFEGSKTEFMRLGTNIEESYLSLIK